MNPRGPYTDNTDFDTEESSGVGLAPVPVKTVRLSALNDHDRTQFFHADSLVERGKAVAARDDQERQARLSAAAPADTTPPSTKPSLLQRAWGASFPRKASALMVVLLVAMFALKPVLQKQAAATPAPATGATQVPAQHALATPPPQLAATPPEPPPVLPRGTTLEKAAVDAVAAGDFRRALSFYRELARRNPNATAYHEAERILEQRVRAQAP
jgi:hypothetical protein